MPRKPSNVAIRGFGQVVPHPRAQAARVSATTWVPTRFTVRVVLDEPPVSVDLDIRMLAGGQPTVAEVGIVSWKDAAFINTTTLRAIPLDHIVRAAVTYAERPLDDLSHVGPGLFRLPGDSDGTVRAFPAEERAVRAAQIYASAQAEGSKAPTEAVALEMHVSRSQASRYIREAREKGLLPKLEGK